MKKVISYSIILLIVLLSIIIPLGAESNEFTGDYNLSVKAYKIDTPLNFIESYESGDVQEISENSTILPGDIIAVGIYVTTYNPIGKTFEISLDWNKELLDQIIYDQNTEGATSSTLLPEYYSSYLGIYGNIILSEEFEVYVDTFFTVNYSKTNNIIDTILVNYKTDYTLSNNGIMYWYFFKVKEDARVDSKCNFTYLMTDGYSNDLEKVNITTNSFTLNIGKNPNYRKMGDINNDGKINFIDKNIISDCITRKVELNEEDFIYADLNKDGKINVIDLMRINDYIIRKIDILE